MVLDRTVMVDGLSIFYREAGRPDAPTLLLLHGFPSSSRMYEPLLTLSPRITTSLPRIIRGSVTAIRQAPRRSPTRSIILLR